MKGNRIGAAVAVIAGLLAGPAVAFGGAALLSDDDPAPATAVVAVAEPAATTTEIVTTTTGALDIAAACGVDGIGLAAAESDGTATVVELAALDALRDVCAAAGMPLPAPPEVTLAAAGPTEIVVIETVEVTAPADTTPAATYDDDDHDDDDEYEEYEHEDEDKDEDEDHGEDD